MSNTKRRLDEQARENLVGNAALGALGVAKRAPHLMPAYLTYICKAPALRAAFQENPVSDREREELHALLFSDECKEDAGGAEDEEEKR